MEKIKYVKDANGRKQGVLIAGHLPNGKIGIGYSQCSKTDKFDREFGLKIASQRAVAYAGRADLAGIPYKVAKELPEFIEKCGKYFKGEELPAWAKKMDKGI